MAGDKTEQRNEREEKHFVEGKISSLPISLPAIYLESMALFSTGHRDNRDETFRRVNYDFYET